MTRGRLVRGAALLTALCAASAGAQQTHVLIITGLGGEPMYSTLFRSAGDAIYTAAKNDWKVAPASLIYLAEDSSRDMSRIKATKEEVAKAFTTLAQRVSPGDMLFVFLVGHGSGEGKDSRVNLPGPDPTAADYAAWLDLFTKQSIVFVNASSASGDFIQVLSKPGRVVVTATKTAMERNESVFFRYFTKGLSSKEADADKDGRISVLEAFQYAKQETAREYETEKKILTEHAVVSDSLLAQTVAFGSAAASADPRVIALVAERRALEDSLAALRGRKAQMDSTAYADALEKLLIAIAEKTQAIKGAGGRQ
ncbi:MAG TPA: hypothetical protein VE967_11995 [Gemmatimonadaceae bacterium]|nr:hypothetical protein [Gemmatimonadaceae bacterium]